MLQEDTRFEFAKLMISEAEKMIIDHQGQKVASELKADGSFVTALDRRIERHVRDKILETFPNDGIIGEEYAEEDKEGEFTWVIDPIDGTASFVRGNPFFGTLLGLLHKGEVIMSFINFPLLDETIYALKGNGCYWKPSRQVKFQRAHVSQTKNWKEAWATITGETFFHDNNRTDLLEKLKQKTADIKTWGDCYGAALVITGRVDIYIEPFLHFWDKVAVHLCLEEAGGVALSLQNSSHLKEKSLIASNGKLDLNWIFDVPKSEINSSMSASRF